MSLGHSSLLFNGNADSNTHTAEHAAMGVVSNSTGYRRGLLLVGNSIAGQSMRVVPTYTTAITAAEVRPGATQITCATGGVAAMSLLVNDRISIGLCNQQYWTVQVTAISGELLTLASPVPRLLRASAGVSKVSAPHYAPLTIRTQNGILSSVNQMLGGPLDLLPGHGHGGATAAEIVESLPGLLAYYRPSVVGLHLFENDVPASTTIEELKRHCDNAVRLCLNHGAIPVVVACLPTTSVTTAPRAAVFDEINAYVLSVASRFPAAVGVNPGALYLDTSNPSFPRQPLAGWTDGVHPVASKRYTIASSIVTALQPVFGSSTAVQGVVGPNVKLTGSGGTASNLTGGSVVPANTTVTAQAGVTCAASKTVSDALYLVGSIAGASNVSTTQTTVSQTFTHPKTWGPNTLVKMVTRVFIEDLTSVSMITVSGSYGTMSTNNQDVDLHLDPACVGKEILIDTPPIPYRDAAQTTSVINLNIRPLTLGSPSGVTFKVEVREMGWEAVPQGEYPLL